MQNLSRRDKNLLMIMLVVVVLAGVLLLMPSGGAAGNGKMLSLAEAKQKNVKAQLAYKAMKADQDRLLPQIKQLTYTMPPEQLTAYVTEDLYALAERAGVHIREIKPLRAKVLSDGSVMRVPLEVRFRAPFQPNVMRFLYYAEDPTKKMVVGKISINSTDTQLKSVDVSAEITVFTRSTAKSGSMGAEGDTSDNTDTTNRE